MINRVILLGRVGKDAELRSTQNGHSVLNFSLATSERHKEGEVTTWHRCVLWGKFAEAIHKFVVKGAQVYVEGKISHREYDDKATGQKRQSMDIVVAELKLLGGNEKREAQDQGRHDEDVPF